jgi:hypothetical protein
MKSLRVICLITASLVIASTANAKGGMWALLKKKAPSAADTSHTANAVSSVGSYHLGLGKRLLFPVAIALLAAGCASRIDMSPASTIAHRSLGIDGRQTEVDLVLQADHYRLRVGAEIVDLGREQPYFIRVDPTGVIHYHTSQWGNQEVQWVVPRVGNGYASPANSPAPTLLDLNAPPPTFDPNN